MVKFVVSDDWLSRKIASPVEPLNYLHLDINSELTTILPDFSTCLTSTLITEGPSFTNWEMGDLPTQYGHEWSRVIYAAGLYVATSEFINPNSAELTTPGMIATSPDGATWTLRPHQEGGLWEVADVTYSPALGLFVAVGFADVIADYNFLTSTDGITWTPGYTGDHHGSFSALSIVVWAEDKSLFVATTEYGYGTHYSSDGVNWTEATVFAGGNRALAYSQDLGLFCVVGEDGVRSATSPDGVVWTEHTHPSLWEKGMVWASWLNLFISVGNYFEPSGELPINTSPDGIVWSSILPSLAYDPAVGASVYVATVRVDDINNKIYVVVAGDQNSEAGTHFQLPSMYLLESSDGITFTINTDIPGTHEYAYPVFQQPYYEDIAIKDATSRVLLGNNTVAYYTGT